MKKTKAPKPEGKGGFLATPAKAGTFTQVSANTAGGKKGKK